LTFEHDASPYDPICSQQHQFVALARPKIRDGSRAVGAINTEGEFPANEGTTRRKWQRQHTNSSVPPPFLRARRSPREGDDDRRYLW
jgi:hypothetical protein